MIRRTVPYADGALLPLTAVADGVRRGDDLPARPRRRRTPGGVDRRGRRGPRRDADLAPPRLPRPRVVPVPLRRRRSRAPAAPLAARSRRDGQRRAAVGRPRRDPVPARGAREDLPHPLPRRLPPREAGVTGTRAAEGRRAAARDLGRGDARHRRHERPRQRAPELRDLPRDALRRDRPGAVRRSRAGAVPGRRRRALQRDRARAGPRDDLAAALDGRAASTALSRASSRSARTARRTSS